MSKEITEFDMNRTDNLETNKLSGSTGPVSVQASLAQAEPVEGSPRDVIVTGKVLRIGSIKDEEWLEGGLLQGPAAFVEELAVLRLAHAVEPRPRRKQLENAVTRRSLARRGACDRDTARASVRKEGCGFHSVFLCSG